MEHLFCFLALFILFSIKPLEIVPISCTGTLCFLYWILIGHINARLCLLLLQPPPQPPSTQFNQHAMSIMYLSPYDFPSPTEMSVIKRSALIRSNTKIDLWFTSPRSVHTNTRIPAPHQHTQSAWRRGDVLTSLVINSDGAQLISNSTSHSFQQWEEKSEETRPNWYKEGAQVQGWNN